MPGLRQKDTMDLPWGDERSVKFITNVGLITSDGPHGPNIMSCEFTHHVAYSPGIIAIGLKTSDATHDYVHKTKEFGVNLAATDQAMFIPVAGHYSARDIDKIKALEKLGLQFTKAKKIKTLMVKGAALQAECKVIKEIPLGSHTLFIGEILEASQDSNKKPVGFHSRQLWELTTPLPWPSEQEQARIKKVVEEFKK